MLPEIITPIPGPQSLALAARLAKHECQSVTFMSPDFPIFWEKAQGCNIWDVDGNRFLDFTSAFGVTGLGHSPPNVLAALKNQADSLIHGMGDVHPTELKVALCEKISEITFERWQAGSAKTLLGNTGFEAVEAALKTSLLATGKAGIITFDHAYHGLGYGTLAAGAMERFRLPFADQLADFGHSLPFPDCHCDAGDPQQACSDTCQQQLSSLDAQLRATIAESPIGAILIEPIQGRGGKVVPPKAFLPMLRRICDETGTLLIFDEILTGLNRCGTLFACDASATIPDLICLGKSLASGLPLSACVGSAELMDRAWPASEGEAIHTTTHLGNPPACAMALAALDLHSDPKLAEQVRQRSDLLRQIITAIDHPRLGRIRGRGLLLGVEILTNNGQPDRDATSGFVVHSLKKGLITLADSPAGNVLSLVPPFDISEEEMRYFADTLQEYLTSLPGS
ncbi:MAG: aminotransferase class III-fold pyridoxal phosphate-dependent enzyme [Verrucomicrobiales bacterium]|nr:aminotransferase class III-fold pyridoxal phosphate-dependent enzyme [Verrucomicrobiales bacterium]